MDYNRGLSSFGSLARAALVASVCSLLACTESKAPPSGGGPQAIAEQADVSTMDRYENLEEQAYAGDYQAQRNLSYTLSTTAPRNPVLGCAWRIVIVESGSPMVDESDIANKKLYCDERLSSDSVAAAEAQAKSIAMRINGQPPRSDSAPPSTP